MDGGADPRPATAPSSPRLLTDGGLTAQEVRGPGTAETSRESPEAPREPPRRAGQSCRRPRRSRTRSQSRASSSADPDPPGFPMLVRYPDGSMGIPFTAGVSPYAETQGRRRPGTRSQASSSSATRSDHPRAEGRARVRQSILYSDRPRHSRPRILAPAVEHIASSSSELSSPVTNLPTFEALSLIDPPLSIPETAEEIGDDYDGFEEHTGDATSSELGPTVTAPSTEEKPTKDSDADKEESLRLLREYYLKYPPTSPRKFVDRILAAERAERAERAAIAAMRGTKPPPPRKPFPVEQETQPLQVDEHASAAVAQPESIAPRCEYSHEASMENIIENGNRWMRDEVMMCFRKYAERRSSKLKILESHLDELCHQCFNVEDYNKVFHHYNFKVKMRTPDSADWTVILYFAEVKEIFGRKYYFCCPLEQNENGYCHACMKQGVEDMKHPATGGFEAGFIDATLFGYAEE